ncbi:MAG: hypothetical protein CM1200mP39_15970 [Dehalococcoidia bacterium]|nr:MAG: hypothetical protein CM1200mP39_15970 [Dehalococcoidia bacterium]
MGMSLNHGGHLTQALQLTFQENFRVWFYGVNAKPEDWITRSATPV